MPGPISGGTGVDLHSPGAIGDVTPGPAQFSAAGIGVAPESGFSLTTVGPDNAAKGGLKLYALNLSQNIVIGFGGLTTTQNCDLRAGGTMILGTNGSSDLSFFTAAAIRMVIKASGVVNIAGIPASASGLSSGDIYSNAGILTIVP